MSADQVTLTNDAGDILDEFDLPMCLCGVDGADHPTSGECPREPGRFYWPVTSKLNTPEELIAAGAKRAEIEQLARNSREAAGVLGLSAAIERSRPRKRGE